jgi:hypothetical protein
LGNRSDTDLVWTVWTMNSTKNLAKGYFGPADPKLPASLDLIRVQKSNVQVSSKILYQAYSNWCENSGEVHLKKNWFGRRLKDKGFEKKVLGSKRARYWLGLYLMDKDLEE